MRGGTSIFSKFYSPNGICSVGFIAHNSIGEYVISAGHCFVGRTSLGWYSGYSNFKQEVGSTIGAIGEHSAYEVGAKGDYGWLEVSLSLSPWYPISSPSSVASLDPYGPWGVNELQYLENVSWSAKGDIVCLTGAATDTSCGEIEKLGVSITYESGAHVSGLTQTNLCGGEGDSGGTVWGNHSGFGIEDAGSTSPSCGPGHRAYFSEAITSAHNMGLSFYVPPYGEL